MTHKRFTPKRGQFFWHIEEIIEYGLPNLCVKHSKFDPSNKIHKKHIKNNNCYLTEDDAYESLMGQ